MATTTDTDSLVFIKQLGGAEDLLFGLGSTSQLREGVTVKVTYINAATIPYDSTRSVKDVLDQLLAGN
jgi:hypothetical protein